MAGRDAGPQVAGAGQAAAISTSPDPALAAQQFNWLVQSIPINQAMLDPEQPFGRAELHRHAAAAVRTFLAAYRPH